MKSTIQLVNKRQSRVVVHGKRSAFDANIEELLLFFGPVAQVASPAPPPAAAAAAGVGQHRMSARELLSLPTEGAS